LAFAIALPPEVWAQGVGGDQAVQAASAAKAGLNLKPDRFGGSAMFGMIDKELYLSFLLRLNIDRDFWGVGVGVPLRFRLGTVAEGGPDLSFRLRKEDWDEPADFLRVLRYVYV